jgi:hypothetical protein
MDVLNSILKKLGQEGQLKVMTTALVVYSSDLPSQ